MASQTRVLLLGISILFVLGNVSSQKFSFPDPLSYERGCGLAEPDNLTVKGDVTLIPGDFLMFQPKVIIQKTMELCTVDLLTCRENVTVTETTMCYCTKSSGDVYSFYVRAQPGTTKSGFELQAVIPSRDKFSGLAGIATVGTIPYKIDNTINVTATYSLNMGEAKRLNPVETVQVCHGELQKMEICLSNLEGGEQLTFTIDDQVTHTTKSCIQVLKVFDFSEVTSYTATFSYSQTRRCHHPQAYTLTLQQCDSDWTTPATVTTPTKVITNTTAEPTTAEILTTATAEPSTEGPSTPEPTTPEPTSAEPTTPEPTTPEPTSVEPTTPEPTTPEPTTPEPTSAEPTTPEPTTPEPATPEPTTPEPTTPEPTTPEPTTPKTTTPEPTTPEPTTTTTTLAPTTPEPITPANVCAMKEGYQARQVVTLEGKDVLCDTESDGGRWIVIQRRQSAEVDFYVGWHYYKAGFGNIRGNFWFGLDNIHELCNEESPCELRVDLKFKGDDYNGTWKNFYIEDESQNYRLNVSDFRGRPLFDCLWFQNGAEFSTKDKDNDHVGHGSCAQKMEGAWWYQGNECQRTNLNGQWGEFGSKGMTWVTVTSMYNSVSFSEMKIRPRQTALNRHLMMK